MTYYILGRSVLNPYELKKPKIKYVKRHTQNVKKEYMFWFLSKANPQYDFIEYHDILWSKVYTVPQLLKPLYNLLARLELCFIKKNLQKDYSVFVCNSINWKSIKKQEHIHCINPIQFNREMDIESYIKRQKEEFTFL